MKNAFLVKGAFCALVLLLFATLSFLIVNHKKFSGIVLEKKAPAAKKPSEKRIKNLVKDFSFAKASSLTEWEEKVLKKKCTYVIEKGENVSYVRAKSEKAASALYYKIHLDIAKRPIISWRWRVDTFPGRTLPETIEGKEEEDFAARVYVLFPAAFFTNSKAIEYIWSETLPEGISGESGYSKNIKVLVLESGECPDWRYERRDIYEDYVMLFGEEPKLDVGAISFMTDADSTKTTADAAYDEIEVGYK